MPESIHPRRTRSKLGWFAIATIACALIVSGCTRESAETAAVPAPQNPTNSNATNSNAPTPSGADPSKTTAASNASEPSASQPVAPPISSAIGSGKPEATETSAEVAAQIARIDSLLYHAPVDRMECEGHARIRHPMPETMLQHADDLQGAQRFRLDWDRSRKPRPARLRVEEVEFWYEAREGGARVTMQIPELEGLFRDLGLDAASQCEQFLAGAPWSKILEKAVVDVAPEGNGWLRVRGENPLHMRGVRIDERGLPVELQAAQPLPQGDAVFTRVFYEYEPFGDRFVRSKVKIELPGTRVEEEWSFEEVGGHALVSDYVYRIVNTQGEGESEFARLTVDLSNYQLGAKGDAKPESQPASGK